MNDEKTWQLTKKVYQVNVRLTTPIYDAILRSLETGAYFNFSECINDLLKQYFTEKGVEFEVITTNSEEEEKEEEVPSDKMVQETVIVNARLPIPMKDGVDRVLETGLYFNISHYLREAIRKDLEARDILHVRKR